VAKLDLFRGLSTSRLLLILPTLQATGDPTHVADGQFWLTIEAMPFPSKPQVAATVGGVFGSLITHYVGRALVVALPDSSILAVTEPETSPASVKRDQRPPARPPSFGFEPDHCQTTSRSTSVASITIANTASLDRFLQPSQLLGMPRLRRRTDCQ
jgi:hypothetical protein